jgi:hypothetical protein
MAAIERKKMQLPGEVFITASYYGPENSFVFNCGY